MLFRSVRFFRFEVRSDSFRPVQLLMPETAGWDVMLFADLINMFP